MKPLRVTVRVQNNRLIAGRTALGMTQPEFARAAATTLGAVNEYENLRLSPLKADGTFRSSAQKIAELLGKTPEELWSDVVLRVETPKVVRELDGRDLRRQFAREAAGEAQAALPSPDGNVQQHELVQAVESLLDVMPVKHAQVLCLRFGLRGENEHTLEEIGDVLGVGKERVRCIEAQVLRWIRDRRCAKSEQAQHAVKALREVYYDD